MTNKYQPSKNRFSLCLLAILIFCIFSHVIAQSERLRGYESQMLLKQSNHTRTVPGRHQISLSRKSQTGNWMAFKNWNEGRCVVAESDSIVWVGTPVGLVRWNVASRTYQTFDETNGLLFTSINSLTLDRARQLWISTAQGIVRYAGGIFTTFSFQNANLPDAPFTCMAVDSSNHVYVGYDWYIENRRYVDGGVATFNGFNWRYTNIDNSIGTFGPSAICVYRDTVWIGAWDNLYVLEHDSVKVAPRWPTGGAASIVVDYQDSLWVETGNQTRKYVAGSWQVIVDRDSEHLGSLWDRLWNDPRGGLWLSGYGPYRLDINYRRIGYRCSRWLPPGICEIPGIPGNFKAHHALSDTSQIFVYEGGLFKFNGTSWQTFIVPMTLLSNDIYGLGVSPSGDVLVSTPVSTQKTDGSIWTTIGDRNHYVYAWNNDFRYSPTGELLTNCDPRYFISGYTQFHSVTGLDFDGYGNLWTGYPLTKYSWPDFSRTPYTDSMMGIQVPPNHFRPQFMDVIVDRNEFVWGAAWYYGGVMFDQTNWHPIPPSDSTLPNGDYDLVFADSRGRVWFATNQSSPNYGFTIYDGKNWNTYYSPQRYAISYVYGIAEDHFGNVWLATGGGLLKYDGSSWILYDRDNSGLNSNYISAVTVDLRGNVWVGTNTGLNIYNPSGSVDLGPYLYSLPVDSLSISGSGKFAKVEFVPHPLSTLIAQYQLQRGRGEHKFWTIVESLFLSAS